MEANDVKTLITQSRKVGSGLRFKDEDIAFLDIIHKVDINADLIKSNKKYLSFTIDKTSKEPEVTFKGLGEFKSYVKAWEQVSDLYSNASGSNAKFMLMNVLKRSLRRWCSSFAVSYRFTDGGNKKNSTNEIKFKFKGSDTKATIVMPTAAMPAYVKILKKLLANYNKL